MTGAIVTTREVPDVSALLPAGYLLAGALVAWFRRISILKGCTPMTSTAVSPTHLPFRMVT